METSGDPKRLTLSSTDRTRPCFKSDVIGALRSACCSKLKLNFETRLNSAIPCIKMFSFSILSSVLLIFLPAAMRLGKEFGIMFLFLLEHKHYSESLLAEAVYTIPCAWIQSAERNIRKGKKKKECRTSSECRMTELLGTRARGRFPLN
ncbi:hypothetical protein NPIL_470181 [Nephila pilipes]|uniref:Uncharacterized protein n=1 Tax=Nephila pilipes TaxID=299642 RepID=A0A8X6NGM0_NEPPI|nr:hypothetical protein NPIL_470181 [Nephila pilipes]